MTADGAAMPAAGTVRIQAEGYPSVFKPTGPPVSPMLRWIRERKPDLFNLRGSWRFEDPLRQYAETYSGTTLKDAAIEVFDRYRVDALTRSLAGAVKRPGGVKFAYPVGSIPKTELEGREVFLLRAGDPFADVMTTASQTWLSSRPQLMILVKRHTGMDLVDSGTITASGDAARVITHRISREVYLAPEHWAGIRYESRIGSGHENWMIFRRSNPEVVERKPLDPDGAQLLEAVSELGLHVV